MRSLTMPRLLLLAIPLASFGCGMDQNDMRKYALKRPSDEELQNSPQTNRNPVPPASPPAATADTSNVASLPANQGVTPTTNVVSSTPPSVPNGGDAANQHTTAPVPSTNAPAASSSGGLSDTKQPDPSLSLKERREMTIQNLQRIVTAIEAYRADQGTYPSIAVHGPAGQPLMSWRVALLPYLGYHALYAQFNLEEAWSSPQNQALLPQIPAVYQSPDRFDSNTNYLLPVGGTLACDGTSRGRHPRRWEDGLENIIVVLEADDRAAVPWTAPRDLEIDLNAPRAALGNLRSDGFFAGFGGGVVYRVPTETSDSEVKALLTVDGGESVFASSICMPAMADVTTAPAGTGPFVANGSTTTPTIGPIAGHANQAPTALGGHRGPSPSIAHTTNLTGAASPNVPALAQQAQLAYESDLRFEAIELALAAYLVDEPLQAVQFQWIPGLKRPATVVRYGLGVDFVGSRADAIQRQLSRLKDQKNGVRAGNLTSVVGELADPILNELERATPFVPPPCQVERLGPGRRGVAGPPIRFLGVGDERTILRAAQDEDLDVVVMFNVDEHTTRTGKSSKSATLRVLDVWTGRPVMRDYDVNYLRHKNSRTDPLYDDPIEKAQEAFAEVLRDQLSPAPMPSALRGPQAQRRVEGLAHLKRENPLTMLAEIKLYRDLDLIDVATLMTAYQTILGDSGGAELLAGTLDEKREAIAAWIPNIQSELEDAANRRSRADDDN